MKVALDSSVLIAAAAASEAFHAECAALLKNPKLRGQRAVWSHALLETFSNVTGGRLPIRITPAAASRQISEALLPLLMPVDLSTPELMAALGEAQSAGVRGGAIYDYLHLVAARKAGAKVLYTLDVGDFRALARKGDPQIISPAELP